MSIEAMRQALEALDAYSWEQVNAARASLRTAIAEAEKQEPVAWAVFEGWNAHDLYLPQEYDEALKMAGYKGDHAEVKPLYTTPPAAQPAPVQEPVGNVVLRDGLATLVMNRDIKSTDQRLYTTPPAAQPAPNDIELMKCWVEQPDGTIDGIASMRLALSKYGTAQRQWVGLTDEEVEKLFGRWCKNNAYTTTLVEFKKAYCYIDAKLKEKNT